MRWWRHCSPCIPCTSSRSPGWPSGATCSADCSLCSPWGPMASMSAIPDRWGVISPWSCCFALGLMAKSMLVTVPPLLLLLDYWPLGRFRRTAAGRRRVERAAKKHRAERAAEKRRAQPAADAVSLAAHLGQVAAFRSGDRRGGRNHAHPQVCTDPLSLPERLANAAVSSVAYLGQLFVPMGLSPFYSHPEAGRPAWQVASAMAAVVGDHGGGGDCPPIVSLLLCRLVLVCRHVGSGDRS